MVKCVVISLLETTFDGGKSAAYQRWPGIFFSILAQTGQAEKTDQAE
jgi:hypothetical protein